MGHVACKGEVRGSSKFWPENLKENTTRKTEHRL
jgi:hypothetical protein